MKILIFGASGKVGSAIFKALCSEYETYGTYNKNKPADINEVFWRELDVFHSDALRFTLGEIKPNLIISSLTGDFLRQSFAHKIMSDYLKETGGRMIFISTANVFDGNANGGNTEASTPYPISQYGNYKQNTEEALLWKLGSNCLVIRLPKIIAGGEIDGIVSHIKKGGGFYSNLYFNFNTAENVANATKYCLQENKSGIVHLVSHGYISDEEWARLTMSNAGIKIDYETLTFSAESYCATLGCKDISKLRQSKDGGFYLTMTCTHEDINNKFL